MLGEGLSHQDARAGTPVSARRTNTDEEREGAINLHVDIGPTAASRELGIPVRTITKWAAASGSTEALTRTSAAVAVTSKTEQMRRTKLADEMLDGARELLQETLTETEHTVVDRDGVPNTYSFRHQSKDIQALVISAAVLVDEEQVLTGGVTARLAVEDDREVTQAAEEIVRLVAVSAGGSRGVTP